MYIPQVSEAIETDIPDPGFEDSKWAGVVKSVDMERKVALIEFKDLLESEKPLVHLTEERAFEHIWPTPVDDSSMDLSSRSVGDAVDCWCDDGWWKGVVYIACNDGLLIYFEATPDLSEIKGVTPETMTNGKERLRTGLDWDPDVGVWVKRPTQIFEGSRDYRERDRTEKPAARTSKETWTDEEMDPCQQFHVSDFLEGRVPYPIEHERTDNQSQSWKEDEPVISEKLKLMANVERSSLPGGSAPPIDRHVKHEKRRPAASSRGKSRPSKSIEKLNVPDSEDKGKMKRSGVQTLYKNRLSKRKALGSKGWERLQQRALIKKQVPDKSPKNALPSQNQEKKTFVEKFRPIPVLDWKTLLNKRSKEEGKFSGLCLCPKVCVDGLGWAYDEATISRSFQEKLVGVRKVEFASGSIFGSGRRYSAGYACLTFDSIDLAVRGMRELDSFYLSIPGCPITRPLIAHFPLWATNPWGMDDVPGQVVLESGVAHFSQMNTIEYDGGIEWRRLNRVHAHAKEILMSSYISEIGKVIESYKHELQQPDPKVFNKVVRASQKQTLYLKAVPKNLTNEFMRSVFEQFDECCKVQRIVNPVVQESMGHVVIGFEDKDKAFNVHSDMNKYLYMAGGTPRPLDVQFFEGGQPKGFESVLDSAILNAFNVNMHEFSDDWFVHVQLRKFDTPQTGRQRCSQAIRKILEKMASDRAALFLHRRKDQLELHDKHATHFREAYEMYKKLSDHLDL